MVGTIKAIVIKPNVALRLRAKVALTDRQGVKREPGEEWLITKEGAYLRQINEEVVRKQKAHVLTDKVRYDLIE